MKRTKEHNQKIAESRKGSRHSNETKKKISESMKGNQNARKKVSPSV